MAFRQKPEHLFRFITAGPRSQVRPVRRRRAPSPADHGRLPTNDETPRLSQGAGFCKLVTWGQARRPPWTL